MKFIDKIKECGLGWIFKDYLYRIDWRKPDKVSIKNMLKRELNIFHMSAFDLPNYRFRSRDERIIFILRWVIDNIRYIKDIQRWSVAEKWQYCDETLNLRTGDCEDGAILIYTWARYLKIPPSHIKLCCGNVVGGGHAWVEYKSEKTDKWYKIDWCYYPDKNYIKYRKDNDFLYKSKWFEVTDY